MNRNVNARHTRATDGLGAKLPPPGGVCYSALVFVFSQSLDNTLLAGERDSTVIKTICFILSRCISVKEQKNNNIVILANYYSTCTSRKGRQAHVIFTTGHERVETNNKS